MAEELTEDPQWEIVVRVPMRLPVEMRQDLFEAVAQTVSRWEPVNRDGWDADVFGCPERDRLTYRESQELLWLHAEAVHWREFESAAAESAEEDNDRLRLENKRLRREAEFEARGIQMGAEYIEFDEPPRTCACGIDYAALDPERWARPQCAVHPEGGE